MSAAALGEPAAREALPCLWGYVIGERLRGLVGVVDAVVDVEGEAQAARADTADDTSSIKTRADVLLCGEADDGRVTCRDADGGPESVRQAYRMGVQRRHPDPGEQVQRRGLRYP